MQRLLQLDTHLVREDHLHHQDFKLTVFGPNYTERDRAFQVLRNSGMLHHYHLTQDSKEEVRYKTLKNIFISREKYNKSIDEAKNNPNGTSLYGNAFIFYDLGFSVRSGVNFYLYCKAIQFLGTEANHR